MTDLLPLATAATPSPADLKVRAYVAFIGLVVVFLALDLGVFDREAHELGMRESITWPVIWLALGAKQSAETSPVLVPDHLQVVPISRRISLFGPVAERQTQRT